MSVAVSENASLVDTDASSVILVPSMVAVPPVLKLLDDNAEEPGGTMAMSFTYSTISPATASISSPWSRLPGTRSTTNDRDHLRMSTSTSSVELSYENSFVTVRLREDMRSLALSIRDRGAQSSSSRTFRAVPFGSLSRSTSGPNVTLGRTSSSTSSFVSSSDRTRSSDRYASMAAAVDATTKQLSPSVLYTVWTPLVGISSDDAMDRRRW
mmetsp:Transcript_20941/g.50440  ORF Transcript_20941/g.50440 Transcript_20941/m.50440 type:complete len:211 (-) Transcript_20941:673-1305(-)